MAKNPCDIGNSADLTKPYSSYANKPSSGCKAKLLDVLSPNIKSLARKYSSKTLVFDIDDARQELCLGILLAAESADFNRCEAEVHRYLLLSAEYRLRSAIDCRGGIRCPSQMRKARNKALTKRASGEQLSSEERETLGALVVQFIELDRPSFVGTDERLVCSAMDDLNSDLYVKLLMERLPTQVAHAISLLYFEEYTYSEAAEILQVSDSQIRSFRQVALRLLKKEMAV